MITGLRLCRLSDDLVYRFERQGDRFRRSYQPVDLEWRDGFGWGAWDGAALVGRPWDVPLAAQSREAPPEGVWVSHRGLKSYAYRLEHNERG